MPSEVNESNKVTTTEGLTGSSGDEERDTKDSALFFVPGGAILGPVEECSIAEVRTRDKEVKETHSRNGEDSTTRIDTDNDRPGCEKNNATSLTAGEFITLDSGDRTRKKQRRGLLKEVLADATDAAVAAGGEDYLDPTINTAAGRKKSREEDKVGGDSGSTIDEQPTSNENRKDCRFPGGKVEEIDLFITPGEFVTSDSGLKERKKRRKGLMKKVLSGSKQTKPRLRKQVWGAATGAKQKTRGRRSGRSRGNLAESDGRKKQATEQGLEVPTWLKNLEQHVSDQKRLLRGRDAEPGEANVSHSSRVDGNVPEPEKSCTGLALASARRCSEAKDPKTAEAGTSKQKTVQGTKRKRGRPRKENKHEPTSKTPHSALVDGFDPARRGMSLSELVQASSRRSKETKARQIAEGISENFADGSRRKRGRPPKSAPTQETRRRRGRPRKGSGQDNQDEEPQPTRKRGRPRKNASTESGCDASPRRARPQKDVSSGRDGDASPRKKVGRPRTRQDATCIGKKQRLSRSSHIQEKAKTAIPDAVRHGETDEESWTSSDLNTDDGQVEEISTADKSDVPQSRSKIKAKARLDDLFDTHLAALKEYAEKHGNTLVPARYPENPSLSKWVISMRDQFRYFCSGRKTMLSPLQIQRLTDAGFVFRVKRTYDDLWEFRYNELKEYKAKYGDCLVPRLWPENKQLSLWVARQREHYVKFQRGEYYKHYAEKIKRLNQLGFVFEPRKQMQKKSAARKKRKETRQKRKSVSSDQKKGTKTRTGKAKTIDIVSSAKKRSTRPPSKPIEAESSSESSSDQEEACSYEEEGVVDEMQFVVKPMPPVEWEEATARRGSSIGMSQVRYHNMESNREEGQNPQLSTGESISISTTASRMQMNKPSAMPIPANFLGPLYVPNVGTRNVLPPHPPETQYMAHHPIMTAGGGAAGGGGDAYHPVMNTATGYHPPMSAAAGQHPATSATAAHYPAMTPAAVYHPPMNDVAAHHGYFDPQMMHSTTTTTTTMGTLMPSHHTATQPLGYEGTMMMGRGGTGGTGGTGGSLPTFDFGAAAAAARGMMGYEYEYDRRGPLHDPNQARGQHGGSGGGVVGGSGGMGGPYFDSSMRVHAYHHHEI